MAVPPRQSLDPRRPILAWPATAALPKTPDVTAQVQVKQAEIDSLKRDIASATARMTAPTAATTPGKLQFQRLPTPKAPDTQASSATQQPSTTDSARAKALVRQASTLPAADPAPASLGPLPPWTCAPLGGTTWPQQPLLDQLCRQGGPETTQVPPTRAIEMRLGHTASFDDQNSTPLYLPFTMLFDYGAQTVPPIVRAPRALASTNPAAAVTTTAIVIAIAKPATSAETTPPPTVPTANHITTANRRAANCT